LSGKTTLRACAVSVMPGKPHNNKIPTCSSLRLVSRSFTSVYVATLRLTTTDVGLMPGLNVAWWLSGRALDLRLTGHGSIPSQSAFTLHMSTQPCVPPGSLNRVLYLLRLGVKAGFSPVWWQVTLCDHIRYVSFP